MNWYRYFVAVAISVPILSVGLLTPAMAQQPDASELRTQIEVILGDKKLSQLDRVRQLKDLLSREEALLVENSIAEWITQLGDAEFRLREVAQQNLIRAGKSAIAAVTRAASRQDRERAQRCCSILTDLAQSDDKATATEALASLQLLSEGTSSIKSKAAEIIAKLNETDKDRAIAAMNAIGARVYQTDVGDVRSVSSMRDFSDREMNLLAAFPRMTSLRVSGEKITDAGLDGLAQLKGLSSISFLKSSISDAGLKKLATFPKLERLSLGSGEFTNNGLRALGESTTLDSLSLFRVMPTKEIIDTLTTLQLRRLTLSLQEVSDEDLQAIGKLEKLSFLSINESPNITDEGLASLSSLKLSSLSFADANLTDEGLRHLSEMTSLTSLMLSGQQITDDGLKHLNKLTNLAGLAFINTSVSKEAAEKLKIELPTLQHVSVTSSNPN